MKLNHSLRFFCILILLLNNLPAFGQRSGENSTGTASQKEPASGPSDQLDFQTDLFTGRFGYQVPMPLAPGRHGSEPTVTLEYNSANDNGWCGVGWNLDFGYIQRETKRGVPVTWTSGMAQKSYDDSKGFVFSLKGKGSSLINISGSDYRSEIENGFTRFVFVTASDQWQATDTSGNKYTFGDVAASRMSNSKTGWSPSTFSGTFRWALSHVETALGDTIDYSYTNISGTLYPLKISYNGHTSGQATTHTVDFILGSRTDVKLSYMSGYKVEQNQRLLAVAHKVSGQVVWSNRLSYVQSPSTARSLLTSITRFGTNLTSSLPPLVFNYSAQSFGFQSQVNWTNLNIPSGGTATTYPSYYDLSGPATSPNPRLFLDLLDVDGDGLPDRVYQPYAPPYSNFWVQVNNGSGYNNPISYALSFQNYADTNISLNTSNQLDWTAINTISTRAADLNGDGYPDRIMDPAESYSGPNYLYNRFVTQFGSGTNFLGSNTSWTNVAFAQATSNSTAYYRAVEQDNWVTLMDMNGDGLPDRVMIKNGDGVGYTNYVVQFNTGYGFTGTNNFSGMTYDTAGAPGTYTAIFNSTYLRILDINGDGLPDRVMYPIYPGTGTPPASKDLAVLNSLTNYVVEFNNGYGFESPVFFGGVLASYQSPAIGTCAAATYYPESYGSGSAPSIQDSEEFALRDINCDGLPDRIYRYHQCGITNWMVQLNTGTNFAAPVLYGPYTSQSQGAVADVDYTGIEGKYARLMDMNGDGIPDHVMRSYPPTGANLYYAVELGKGPFPDLMNVVSNGIGGSMTIAYKSSTQYDNRESTNSVNARELMPFPVQTVSSISVSDGFYPSNTTTFAYEGGMWSPQRREFHGFAHVTETDALGSKSSRWFHQAGGRDNSALGEYQDSITNIAKSGMPFRIETIGTNGVTYKLVLNKVEDFSLGNGRHFGFVSQTLALDYPGSSSAYRATAQQFAYNLGNGNLTNAINFGEVTNINVSAHTFTDTPNNDTTYQITTYATLSNTNIVDKPQRKTLTTDSAGTQIVRESLFDYNGSSGTLAKERDRMCPTCYLTNGFGYDSYNNVSTATNEAGIVTATVYESTYHTFPSQQTIGGLFTSTSDYDERSGKLLSSMDIKGLVTANIYDPFLRPLETDVSTTSNGTANVWLARYDYTLGMASGFSTNSVRVRKSDGVDASNGHETWTYADGLGRVFQTRDESETSGSYRVSDTVYDKRGDVQFVLLPYFSSGTAFTKPTSTEMGALHIYDPVARLTNVTAAVNGTFTSGLLTSTSLTGGDANSPIGSVSIAFNFGNDPWTWVVTDEAGKVHRYSLDGYGRTNQIVEVVGASIYTTRLAYNPASDLTNITDNAGNQIQFGVNDLGQMIALADPDMGIWQYQRDFAGRIRNQIDANNQKIVFNYNDPLGRLKSRQIYDFHTNFVYGLTNIYDVSDDANFPAFPGQLYKVIDKEGFSKNGYDLRGRALKTARFLNKNGSTYTNQFAYDDANRARQIIYPNGGPTITNIFDTGGNLFQVKQVGGSGTAFYTAQGFTALDQLTGITFGNGVTTAYSYYSNSKRLQQLVTSGSKQNLTYTYDQVSNIKSIADAAYSSTNSAALSSLTYDDLHQLTSLTRPAIGQTTPFSFDSIGNFSVNGENGAGAYNYGVRMPHAVKSANGQTNAYDACGNMMVRGNQRLAYDPENHLAYVVTPTGGIYFGYDAADARLWKSSVNGLQVWIGGNYEEKNGLILFHIFAGDQTVCTFDKFGTNVFAYYHPDPLHSTSIETDQSGNRIQHYEYMAFGKDRYTESSTEFPISRRYTGQVLDDETGLYYYNARYYDPQLGRFIQADTIIPDIFNPQTYNRYAYCGNNPLKNTDPSGHNWAVFTWDAWKQLASDIFIGDTGSSRVDPNSAAGLRNSMGVGVTPLRDEHGNIVQPGDAVKQIGGAVVGGVIDTAMYLGGEGEAKGAYQAADKLLEAKKFENAAADIHHIATDKNLISKAAGGPFTPKFEALFEKGGMTLQDALNKVPVLGHKGPHAEYNKIVYQRLSQAVEGLKGNAYKQALQNQLKAIGEESATKGSALNKLITK